MIDINELHRLAQDQEWIGRWYDAGCETLMAERDGEHEEVAHPMPIGLVPYLVAVQPAAITELLDRLEAAEQERDNANAAAVGIALQMEKLQAEHDTLRAKIEQMERQEPSHWGCTVLQSDGRWKKEVSREAPPEGYFSIRDIFPLYALPGAQPAPSAPDEARERVMAAIAHALGDAYDCTRVWSAWG